MEDQMYITIAKVLHGEASDAERRELDAWIKADESHAAIFEEMKAAWGQADTLFDAPAFNAGPAWEKVATRIHQPAANTSPGKGRLIPMPAWIKYSSAIAAILLIAVLIWNPFRTDNIRVIAEAGNKRVELPDHSVVTLREGSTLSYPKSFASTERNVTLEGVAFFEVSRNEQQPFVVDAQSVSVRVLGTSFNVQCSEQAADVTVTTGSVQVSAKSSGGDAVILSPGRSAHYSGGKLSQGAASGTELFWRSGELNFNNEAFSKVLATLSDVSGASIQFDTGVSPAQREQAVTISFRGQSTEDMLTELCLITKCRWEKSGAGYIVKTQ